MQFKRVSYEQYLIGSDQENTFYTQKQYDDIMIPKRATIDSAGYDFFLPFDIELKPNETIKIPTGIKWLCESGDYYLSLYPRSGLGFKYQLGITNTVGVVDWGYSGSDNEGHIFIKLVNRGDKKLSLKQGDAFAQGIINKFYKCDDDDVLTKRNGGLGSTSK